MALAEKRAQRMAKKAFTKARNILFSHIQNGVKESKILASMNLMDDQFVILEESHLKHLGSAQIDMDKNQEEANYHS